MPRNLFSLAKHIRALYLRRLCEAHPGIKFIEGTQSTRNAVGIHCFRPEEWELERAIERAESQGFEAIYIYTQE